jgi:uncharacterized protein YciI
MIGSDRPDGAERRDRHRAAQVAHIESLDREGRIAMAGTTRNDSDNAFARSSCSRLAIWRKPRRSLGAIRS